MRLARLIWPGLARGARAQAGPWKPQPPPLPAARRGGTPRGARARAPARSPPTHLLPRPRRARAGGGTVAPSVATIFADPWPEDLLSSLLFTLSRRLHSAPGAAEYLLACAGAAARAAPARVRHEQIHQMWDTCLRWASVWTQCICIYSMCRVCG